MSVSRLAPKVTVAITTTMARVVPTMAERTGTVAGRHPYYVTGLLQTRVDASRPVKQRGELHHLEHVAAVVALGGVVREPDALDRRSR